MRRSWPCNVSLEPSFVYKQLHHLFVRLFGLSFLDSWSHYLRLLHRAERLLSDQRSLQRKAIVSILLLVRSFTFIPSTLSSNPKPYRLPDGKSPKSEVTQVRLPLERLRSLHRRHLNQHRRLRRRNRPPRPHRRDIHLQRQFLRRFHRRIWRVLSAVQNLTDPGDQ